MAHPAKEGPEQRVICLLCFGFHQKPKAEQDSEADTGHRVAPTGAIYRRLIHRNEPKPPTYLFRYSRCQRARETKTDRVRPNFTARPPDKSLRCSIRLVCSASAFPPHHRPVWRPNRASAPPVRGYLRILAKPRKRKIAVFSIFLIHRPTPPLAALFAGAPYVFGAHPAPRTQRCGS